MLRLGGNHTANCRGCIKWNLAKMALAKRMPERVRKSAATGHFAAPKVQRTGPSAKQVDLREGWNHGVHGVLLRTPPPHPKPSPQQVTEAPTQPKLTATRKTARPKKPKPKSREASKPATFKPKKKAATRVKTAAVKPTTTDLVVPTQFPTPHSRTSVISIAYPSLPNGAARRGLS